ncbi:hypothetical protein QN224_13025 [Sinorhizobium sp. 8-89]|uniref:hypothetical protein n=1 Tax=Sinorhizobium sp. 7-81 TaxID=3049087 RepID=UPI0024C20C71|nr:hypothetical protein [Sinorhizobium sp. 7-81]MDK1386331.1 hypothetical protein [Sinorhizobium sp. 7-81]
MPDARNILEDSFKKLIDQLDGDGDFDEDGVADLRCIFFAGAQSVLTLIDAAKTDEEAAAAIEAIDREIDAHIAEFGPQAPETLQ